jgi:TRAP-type C4-dicarboxylate transport system substrate-binding protein
MTEAVCNVRNDTRLFLLAVLACAIAACSPSPQPSSETESASNCDAGDCESSAIEITIGGTSFPGTVGEQMWLDFQRDSEANSDGELRLKMLIYGQLGSEEHIVSGLRRGRVHYANLSALVTSTLVPEVSLLYAPYLFADEAEADFIYDNYLTEIFTELLGQQDLHLVSWYEIGFHSIYAIEPLVVPADAINRRYRVSSALSSRLFAEAIDADVIPLGFSDIVSSLQTGLIEAGDNGISLYTRTGTADEAPNLTLTKHAFGMSIIVSRKSWWDSMTPAHRKILVDAFPTAERSRREIRAESNADLENGKALGIVIHRPTPEQIQLWRDKTAGITEALIEQIGGRAGEVYDLVLEGRAAFRSRSGTN